MKQDQASPSAIVPDNDFAAAVERLEEASTKLTLAAKFGLDIHPYMDARAAARSTLLAQHDALRVYAKALTVAFTGYVGGGSELFGRRIGEMYTADIEFCIQRLRDRDRTQHEHLLKAVRDKRAAEARHALDQAPEPRGCGGKVEG